MITLLWHIFLIILLIFGITFVATMLFVFIYNQVTQNDSSNITLEKVATKFVALPTEEQEKIIKNVENINKELDEIVKSFEKITED